MTREQQREQLGRDCARAGTFPEDLAGVVADTFGDLTTDDIRGVWEAYRKERKAMQGGRDRGSVSP